MGTWLEDNVLNKYDDENCKQIIYRDPEDLNPKRLEDYKLDIQKLKKESVVISIPAYELKKGDRIIAFNDKHQWIGIIKVEGIKRLFLDLYEIYGINEDEDRDENKLQKEFVLKIIDPCCNIAKIKERYYKEKHKSSYDFGRSKYRH